MQESNPQGPATQAPTPYTEKSQPTDQEVRDALRKAARILKAVGETKVGPDAAQALYRVISFCGGTSDIERIAAQLSTEAVS